MNKTTDLNANEIKVLDALIEASALQGHDFGFTDDVWNDNTRVGTPDGPILDESEISKSQFSGYVTQIIQKGYVKSLNDYDPTWKNGFQLTLKGAAYAGVELNYETT